MAGTVWWRSLELAEDLPRLLVKTRFDKDGYDIQLTDLSRIWGEHLGENEIVGRANEEGCSIDPSEDDQYEILLEKIGSALAGDKGTTLDLHAQDNGHSFQLDVSAPLPGSLPTFKWTINLARMPDSTVGAELVTPLIGQATELRQQIQSLIDELASKDRVIAKITDRLETSGNDLTAVFPGVSNIKTSRKKSQRAQLAGHVKGLGDFDEDTWRASLKQDPEPADLTSDALNKVLEGLAISKGKSEDPTSADWWTGLSPSGSKTKTKSSASRDSQKGIRSQAQQRNGTAHEKPSLHTEESLIDDEFQRQGTSPQLKKSHISPANDDERTETTADEEVEPRAAAPIEDEETEDDDDDLDARPSNASSSQTKGRSQQQASHEQASAGPKRLGLVGGKKSKSPQPEPEPEQDAETEDEEMPASKPKPKARLGAFGGKKKSVTPEPASVRPVEAEAEVESVQPEQPKSKSRLGAFGGKSRAAAPSSPPKETQEQEGVSKSKPKSRLGAFGGKGKASAEAAPVKVEDEEDAAPAPAKGKLGNMRGKSSSKDAPAAEEEPERQSRAPEKVNQEKREREGSQERADKKRERLKRELEEKAKGPAKKKRKF